MSAASAFRSGPGKFQALLEQAACAGTVMLSRVLAATRQSMRDDVSRMRGLQGGESLDLSIKLLDQHAPQLAERYPTALRDVFQQNSVAQTRPGVLTGQGLHLDQLELMDESQLKERVELARARQHVLLKAEAPLTELNGYISAMLGLEHVSPESNPLRPDSYISALQALMTDLSVPALARVAWLQHLPDALGEALGNAYQEWVQQLRGQGVKPVGFVVMRTPEPVVTMPASATQPERQVWSPEYRQTVLTLDRLRALMAGDLDLPVDNSKEAFARAFAREFESGTASSPFFDDPEASPAYEKTVPAAFEALQEMQQVDLVVKRLEQRPVAEPWRPDGEAAVLAVRRELMQQASGVSQRLSLEVVTLMIENLVQDARLIRPIRKIIERLEPALLRLVLIDPRFFVDRQHPARRLLQEVSGRGLAYGSVDDPDFNAFWASLQRYVRPLGGMQIDGAQVFEQALNGLLMSWKAAHPPETVSSQMDSAVAALGQAEERNLLAESISTKLSAIPDIRRVPSTIAEFLTGPWAQVIAGARLKNTTTAEGNARYQDMVKALLWSAQPELTKNEVAKLTKLVPRLLTGLREGLRLIDYPAVKTSAFFDVLMKLHQQAFRPDAVVAIPIDASGLEGSLLDDRGPWVAPSEIQVSGFMAFVDDSLPSQHDTGGGFAPMDDERSVPQESVHAAYTEPVPTAKSLQVGAWVDLQGKAGLQRTQLSWISPHGTMYLFTSVQGKTQSMTLRMMERMLTDGTLRVVSTDQQMVDSALDAVVHTAMLNSLDIRL